MQKQAGRFVMWWLLAAAAAAVVAGCGGRGRDPVAHARAQFAAALRDSGLVTSAALVRALETVPLHELVQPAAGPEIYSEMPVAGGVVGSAPPVVDAVMVEAAGVKRGNKVLDVAPGIGYRAALCAKLGARVCCVVGSPDEEQRLRDALKRVGCGSVAVELGIKSQGCPKYGPFNILFADWDAASIPEAIIDQIRNQGRVVLLPRPAADRILVLKCQKTTLSPLETISVADVLARYRTARAALGK